MNTKGSSIKLTTNDILGFWKNNMDVEEKKLYEDLKATFAKLCMPWGDDMELGFAEVANQDTRKEIMADYLARITRRLNSVVCPKPDNWSI